MGLSASTAGVFTDVGAPEPVGGLPQVSAMDAADVNGDGIDDAILAGPGWIGVQAFDGERFGPLRRHRIPDLDPLAILGFDATADSKTDLFVADRGGRIEVLVGDGNFGFLVGEAKSAGPNPASLVHGDIDRDGFEDLVIGVQGRCCPLEQAGLRIYYGGQLTDDRTAIRLE